jgi:hypothetical protein
MLYQTMQEPASPQKQPSSPRRKHGSLRWRFGFFSSHKHDAADSGSQHQHTLKKRPPPLQTSGLTTDSVRSADAIQSPTYLDSPAFRSFPEMARMSIEAQNPTAKVRALLTTM